MKKVYRFADSIFEIESVYDYFHQMAKEYLSSEPFEHVIKITNEDIEEWVKSHNDCDNFEHSYIETLVIHSKVADVLALQNKFIFHGSSIYLDSPENAYIFTAPSGTGKSTHVRLLKKIYGNRVNYINDDKPFIFNQDENITVYGSPWNGKERLSNDVKGTLKGIFILTRGNSNTATRISPKEAISKLVQQLHMPKGICESTNATKCLIDLSSKVPIYLLEVNMDDSAAVASYSIMNNN